MFADQAIKKVLSLDVTSILDLGSGKCEQATKFAEAGKKVTAVDHQDEPKDLHENITYLKGMIDDHMPMGEYDCVWAAHVIEHMPNVQQFLLQMINCCKEGGIIAITFPPLKHQIVGGHINLLNPGIVLYRLALCGLDTTDVMIKQYGYNISVILKKKYFTEAVWDRLLFDNGDIEVLSEYLPRGYNFQGFNGDIKELNW